MSNGPPQGGDGPPEAEPGLYIVILDGELCIGIKFADDPDPVVATMHPSALWQIRKLIDKRIAEYTSTGDT